MRKINIGLLILLVMFIPFVSNAKSCDTNKISIDSITLEKQTGTATETDSAIINGNKIVLNLSMKNIEDSIEYKVIVNNSSNDDYEFNKDDFMISSNYIDYSISINDNSNIIKANSSKDFYLKVKYENEVPDDAFESGTYNDNKSMTVQLLTGDNNILDIITNPKTGGQLFILVLLVLVIVSTIIYIVLRKNKYLNVVTVLIISLLIPISVFALCKYDLKIESNVSIVSSGLNVLDCDNNKKYTTAPSGLKGLAKIMAMNAYLDNGKSEYVSSCNGVNFNDISSDTNGKGIYEIASTKNDEYPIYYYRGEVDNNVKFGGFCWKAIRTTDTGGVKMIYNGTPDGNGNCTNTTGGITDISGKAFNSRFTSPADVGYMYGTRYDRSRISENVNYGTNTFLFGDGVTYSNGTYTLTNPSKISDWGTNYTNYVGYYTCSSTNSSRCESVKYIIKTTSSNYYYFILTDGVIGSSSVIYGGDVTYSDGTYTLIDTITIKPSEWLTKYNTLNNNHYTCFSDSSTCSSVYYIYYTELEGFSYISLSNSKKVEDALDEMFNGSNVNSTNSTAKATIDTWYNTNLSSYTSYIEDTIYCNDRSISNLGGFNPEGGNTASNSHLYFGSWTRTNNYEPSLTCSRETDRFTVSSSKGNGALTYPVGLITLDEVMYAGGSITKSNSTYYLYNNLSYWTGTPKQFVNYSSYNYDVSSTGRISSGDVYFSYGIRPVVSLNSSTAIASGDGTTTNPYVVSIN